MLTGLRYYWVIAKGYRVQPWKSPYIRWRMETFFGHEAASLNPYEFVHLLWRERRQLRNFLKWVSVRRRANTR